MNGEGWRAGGRRAGSRVIIACLLSASNRICRWHWVCEIESYLRFTIFLPSGINCMCSDGERPSIIRCKSQAVGEGIAQARFPGLRAADIHSTKYSLDALARSESHLPVPVCAHHVSGFLPPSRSPRPQDLSCAAAASFSSSWSFSLADLWRYNF